VRVSYDLDAALPKTGRVMMLRVQRERMNGFVLPECARVQPSLRSRQRRMALLARTAIVMHPGPMNRGMEITAEVADSGPRSVIVEQVANGVTVRMAVLYLLLGGSGRSAWSHGRTDRDG
jgi:aspartate carbamoyltransferase catalytic subunit